MNMWSVHFVPLDSYTLTSLPLLFFFFSRDKRRAYRESNFQNQILAFQQLFLQLSYTCGQKAFWVNILATKQAENFELDKNHEKWTDSQWDESIEDVQKQSPLDESGAEAAQYLEDKFVEEEPNGGEEESKE